MDAPRGGAPKKAPVSGVAIPINVRGIEVISVTNPTRMLLPLWHALSYLGASPRLSRPYADARAAGFACVFGLLTTGNCPVSALRYLGEGSVSEPGRYCAVPMVGKSPVADVPKTRESSPAVLMGDVAKFSYKVLNRGTAPLKITAKPTCGCTVVTAADTIAPGGSAMITAELRTDRPGTTTKTIKLTTNDPDHREFDLEMVVVVKPVVAFQLPSIVRLKAEGATTLSIPISVEAAGAAEAVGAVSSSNQVTAKLASVGGDPLKKQYNLALTFADGFSLGRNNLVVTVYTNSSRQRTADMQLTCEKGIVMTPSGLFLGDINGHTPKPIKQVASLSTTGKPFKVISIDNDDPQLEVQAIRSDDGLTFRVDVSYKGGWKKGFVLRSITIHTDDPKQPSFRLPIAARVSE